jgi:CRISPR system Cascade subunit CasC
MAKTLSLTTLVSYCNTSLNRDEIGLSKTADFHGVTRGRISSQCMKYHWRWSESMLNIDQRIQAIDPYFNLEKVDNVRSRKIFSVMASEIKQTGEFSDTTRVDSFVAKAMLKIQGKNSTDDEAQADETNDNVSVENIETEQTPAKKAKAKKAVKINLDTPQLISMSDAEIAYVKDNVLEALRKNNLDLLSALNLQTVTKRLCPSTSLFGKFSTFKELKTVDGSLSVAHRVSIHRHNSQQDFFTATDDLDRNSGVDSTGTAHLGYSEMSSNTYAGFDVVDLEQFCMNLFCKSYASTIQDSTSKQILIEVLSTLISTICTTSPGGKKTGTAPFQNASFALVELSNHPQNKISCFDDEITLGSNLLPRAYARLIDRISESDDVFGSIGSRAYYALQMQPEQHDAFQSTLKCTKVNLGSIAQWLDNILV